MVDEAQPLLSKDQVATLLGVRPRYVDRLMKEGRLPYYKIGRLVRFQPGDVAAYLMETRVQPESHGLPTM